MKPQEREVPGIVKRMKSLLIANEAFGAACVFESHLSTHPVIRLNPEALVLAVKIYSDLNKIQNASDIVDFVEEHEIKAPGVFNTLLGVFIRRGEVNRAEELLKRMKKAQCEITPDVYYKMSQLFAMNDREDQIKEIHQESLLWFPEDAHRIQAVLVRYYLANNRMTEAQELMYNMYVSGVPFHHSIFSSLLETRLKQKYPDAILHTLKEMNALGVTPNLEFSTSVIRDLLKSDAPDVAMQFISGLTQDKHVRTPFLYHLIMKYYYDRGNHWANIEVFNAIGKDPIRHSPFSFMRVIPSIAAILSQLNLYIDQEEKEVAIQRITKVLLKIVDDLISSGVDPQPMSVGYIIDLLAQRHPQKALELAKHSSSQLKNGAWKRTASAINVTAYGLYHYATLEEQCKFVDYIIECQIIPPSYVIAIIIRQTKQETDAAAPRYPSESRFDLDGFISLIEQHAFHLEVPAYIVDRFASALIDRGETVLASRLFAAAMSSLKPITQKKFGGYKELTSWHKNLPSSKTSTTTTYDDNSLLEPQIDLDLDKDIDLKSMQRPLDEIVEIDVDQTERYSRQFERHPDKFELPDEEDPTATSDSDKLPFSNRNSNMI
jgi:pentatricopeptide repeat protein